MDTILFAGNDERVGVCTHDKRLVLRTPKGDRPMENMPVPPPDAPDYQEKLRVWRSSSLTKWFMTQVVGLHGEDLPQVENGKMPKLKYDRKMNAYRIVE